MLILGGLEKCRRYIESHSHERKLNNRKFPAGPCITISRETGTCAKCVSEELIKFFQGKSKENKSHWTIFDKNLIEKVLTDHQLPGFLEKLMGENKISFFASMLNEMLSGLPGQWTLIRKQSETILQVAALGSVIIIGRGANIITQNLSNAFHVRLIAPLNERIKTFAEVHRLDFKKAKSIVEQHDTCRMKYVYTVFNRKIDDPSLYHIVINTKRLTFKQIANTIGLVIIERFPGFFLQMNEDTVRFTPNLI
jgi:hypothetical protein